MRHFKRISSLLIAVVLVITSLVMPAFAAIDDSSFGTKLTDSEKEYLEANLDTFTRNETYLTTSSSNTDDINVKLTIDGTTYFVSKGKKSNDVKSKISSGIATQTTGNITHGLDWQPDTEGAVMALGGFRDSINMILGIVVTLITVGLAVFTAADVCYIVFPVFRGKCDEQKMQGSGPMVQKTANGSTKLRFVSDEAVFAVQHATLEQGANPLMSYFKNRLITYIVVAIILFILLTGNISLITDIALRMVSGIMNLLSSWG